MKTIFHTQNKYLNIMGTLLLILIICFIVYQIGHMVGYNVTMSQYK